MVTGESMPVSKEPGARVIGGTVNQGGGFVMQAQKIGRDTMLARIVQMVAEAQRSRAPIQRLADQVSGWFVPAVLAIAALAFVGVERLGAGAALQLCPGCGGLRADHRLPMRARPGHADVDHGRRRARCASRRAGEERRGAGAAGEGRHHRHRQDRHADGRQAEGCRDQDGGRRRRSGAAAPRRQPGARQRASAGGCYRRGGEGSRHRFGRRGGVRRARRQGRDWRRGWALRHPRQSRDDGRGGRRHGARWMPRPTRCERTAQPRSSSPSTASLPVSSPSPIRSSRPPLPRWPRSRPPACASSC